MELFHKQKDSCPIFLQERKNGGVSQQNLIQIDMLNFLKNVTRGKPDWGMEEMQRMIGILRTNGMKLEQGSLKENPGVVLYPTYCLINHACSNNTNYQKYSDHHIELRSQVLIKKGQEISTRYSAFPTFSSFCAAKTNLRPILLSFVLHLLSLIHLPFQCEYLLNLLK